MAMLAQAGDTHALDAAQSYFISGRGNFYALREALREALKRATEGGDSVKEAAAALKTLQVMMGHPNYDT